MSEAFANSDSPLSTASLARLDQQTQVIRQQNNISALAYVIVDKDRILHASAQGFLLHKPVTASRHAPNATNNHKLSLDSIFRLGSITKSFTALALLHLQQQGKVSIDAPLSHYTPHTPLQNPWTKHHPVTIAHLLEHTSGLLDLTKREFDEVSRELSLQQALHFNQQPRMIHWQPGLHKSYSNAGAGYAAHALETISGQSYEDYVEQHIFKPLGMHQAGFYKPDASRVQWVQGYDEDGRTPIPYWYMLFRAFGAINTSAREMAAFVQMFLNDGEYQGKRIVSAQVIQRMQTPGTSLAARHGLRYGYGAGLDQHIRQGFVFYGHGGDGDGYLSRFAYNRELSLGYFAVLNAFNYHAMQQVQAQIEHTLIQGRRALKPVDEQDSITAKELGVYQKMLGEYQAVTYRFAWQGKETLEQDRVRILLDQGRLYLARKGREPQALSRVGRVGPYLFRESQQPLATLAIMSYEGNWYLQGDMGNYRKLP